MRTWRSCASRFGCVSGRVGLSTKGSLCASRRPPACLDDWGFGCRLGPAFGRRWAGGRSGLVTRPSQLTPPGSACSIAIGKGLTQMAPGSFQNIQVAVSDIDAARTELLECGVEASEVQDLPGGRFVFFSDPEEGGPARRQVRVLLRSRRERLGGAVAVWRLAREGRAQLPQLGGGNHRRGGTSSGSPKFESTSGPRKVVISAIPSPSSVSTEMLRGRKLCHSSSQR